jgi:hypothetical protein
MQRTACSVHACGRLRLQVYPRARRDASCLADDGWCRAIVPIQVAPRQDPLLSLGPSARSCLAHVRRCCERLRRDTAAPPRHARRAHASGDTHGSRTRTRLLALVCCCCLLLLPAAAACCCSLLLAAPLLAAAMGVTTPQPRPSAARPASSVGASAVASPPASPRAHRAGTAARGGGAALPSWALLLIVCAGALTGWSLALPAPAHFTTQHTHGTAAAAAAMRSSAAAGVPADASAALRGPWRAAQSRVTRFAFTPGVTPLSRPAAPAIAVVVYFCTLALAKRAVSRHAARLRAWDATLQRAVFGARPLAHVLTARMR